MAGILDEVMDGIAAKEKEGQTPPATTPTTQETPATSPEHKQTQGETKPMNTYSDDFKNKYGDKKNA
jgi:hypothetical protein